jgi:hypothetical protein
MIIEWMDIESCPKERRVLLKAHFSSEFERGDMEWICIGEMNRNGKWEFENTYDGFIYGAGPVNPFQWMNLEIEE